MYVGRVRSLVVLLSLSLVTLTIYWFVWFWRFNKELYLHEEKQGSGVGRWLLFLLVPFIGWFVAAWLAGRQLRRLQLRAGVETPTVPVYAASWAGLVPVFGWLGAAGALQAGANRLWLRVQQAFELEAKQERTLECPKCHAAFRGFVNVLMPEPRKCPSCGHSSEVSAPAPAEAAAPTPAPVA